MGGQDPSPLGMGAADWRGLKEEEMPLKMPPGKRCAAAFTFTPSEGCFH